MKKVTLIVCVFFTLCFLNANEDISLFNSGRVIEFSSIDYIKAKGLNLTLRYPDTWVVSDGKRPNALCNISKPIGKDTILDMVILVKDFPKDFDGISDIDIASELYSDENLSSFLASKIGRAHV